MPETNQYNDQLQAYALGCLDTDDLKTLKAYLSSGKDYPWQELGEYQNLAALLPAILNMEMAEPILKDKVARKLYRIRDEGRVKKSTELNRKATAEIPGIQTENFYTTDSQKTGDRTVDQPELVRHDESEQEPAISDSEKEHPVEFVNGDTFVEENFFDLQPDTFRKSKEEDPPVNDSADAAREYERVKPARKTSEFFVPGKDSNNQVYVQNEKDGSQDFFSGTFNKIEPHAAKESFTINTPEPSESKSSKGLYIVIILLLLIIAGGVYAYYAISSEVKTYKSEVEKLNEEIISMNPGATGRAGIQQMLEKPDTRVINLLPVQIDSHLFGRVIINPGEKKGFLQLGGLPLQTYQLWITINNKFVSLGVFDMTHDVEYFQFDLPVLEGDEKKLVLTNEQPGGAAKPGANLYMTGSI